MPKMRLRVKLIQGEGGPSKHYSVLLDENCDWQQLQAAVVAEEPQLKCPALSLNKKARQTSGPRGSTLIDS